MPRLPAQPRRPALPRKPLTRPRNPIKIPSDDKIKVVLDTTILVRALIEKKRGHINKASYQIVEAFKRGVFQLMMNASLLAEYERVLHYKAREGEIESQEIGSLIRVVRQRGYYGRMFVDKPVQTHQGKDDLLFDSANMLEADYLVSTSREVGRLKSKAKNSSLTIIQASKFLRKILKTAA